MVFSFKIELPYLQSLAKANPFRLADKSSSIAFGTNISNIGAKISYTEAANSDFIPTNLRLGTTLNMELDEFNKFSFSIDANKLLVPTNPYYHPINGDIVSGRNPDVGVASGIFGSFTDAPGNVFEDNGSYYVESGSVFKEELNEINLSFGAEFLYSELFALRAGYFHEHPTKGNRIRAIRGQGYALTKWCVI